MTDVAFSALDLSPKIEKAVAEMGFEIATPVQAESIPLIRTGVDVIARSQTGTGKTVAFAIPALEVIDTTEEKPTIQVLILLPTRELAQQAGEEIRKLAKFMTGIRPVEVYGGSDMERQFIHLRRGNMVIGTPGRVMDHMRRGTIKLGNLKMIVLDEADEMLKMGFKEDIETILLDTPENRQTVLFSATMPPLILSLTRQFQKNPQLIEINKSQVTLDNIAQSCVDVPVGRKTDALILLLRYHRPSRALIFCNTKRMVDELSEQLNQHGFNAESIHGDLKQSQRTNVMNGFKAGKISILIATDVAARGIDVNDIDYVINYDIPIKTEYYVHRIGRTGRAGKSGSSITICSGRRQVSSMRILAREVKSEIRQDPLPTAAQVRAQEQERNLDLLECALSGEIPERFATMVEQLTQRGHTAEQIAAAALWLKYPEEEAAMIPDIGEQRSVGKEEFGRMKSKYPSATVYADIVIDIGSDNRVAPNHLVGAITEWSGISGKEIGKIEIYPQQSVVGIPASRLVEVLDAMRGCKVCGRKVTATRLTSPMDRRKGRTLPQGPESKSAFFAGQRISKRQSPIGGDPVRRAVKD